MTLEELPANASRKYQTSQSMEGDGLREAILSGVYKRDNHFARKRLPISLA